MSLVLMIQSCKPERNYAKTGLKMLWCKSNNVNYNRPF